jgi:GMC oxidoreductase
VNVLVRGLKLIFKITATRSLSDTIDEAVTEKLFDQEVHKQNDEKLVALAKDRVETLYHPCCTARMAPLAEDGVVDPYLRVHGVSNLRVVDASVFPNIITGHLVSDECLQGAGLSILCWYSLTRALTVIFFFIQTAVVLAVAEQASDLIKSAIGADVLPSTKSSC